MMSYIFGGLAAFFAVAAVIGGILLSRQAYRSFDYRSTQPADTNDLVAIIVWSATLVVVGLAALVFAAIGTLWQ